MLFSQTWLCTTCGCELCGLCRGCYTEPRIQMDSIRSPSGVFLESIWTSLKVAATVHYQRILLDSRYTPGRLLMESIRMETIPGLLIQSCKTQAGPIVQMDSTKANWIIKLVQKKTWLFVDSNSWLPTVTISLRLTTELLVHARSCKLRQ